MIRQLLLLCSTTGYQTRAFVEAAGRTGARVLFGTDRCHVLDDPWRDGALPLRFEDPEESAHQIVEYARTNPVGAIVALGDRPTPAAARACQALGLPFHPPQAADICRDKYLCRARLRAEGLCVPPFVRFPLESDAREIVRSGASSIGFPCVLKPLTLSGSRGVIRADDPEQFRVTFERIRALLERPEIRVLREETNSFVQVEGYVEGDEVAAEGLVDRGQTRILALFDKPEPLVGPYFEETIYVTPSRLPADWVAQIVETLERAVKAVGLYHGPFHAELRINARGVWVLEVAARPIGGLCSRALRFRSASPGDDLSLEEVLIRLAFGDEVRAIRREEVASGVMMIPIARAGIFQEVQGVEAALMTPGVEDIQITAKPAQKVEPLPEGSSYLGFIFARGPSPEFVESALRTAHQKLRLVVAPALPVI